LFATLDDSPDLSIGRRRVRRLLYIGLLLILGFGSVPRAATCQSIDPPQSADSPTPASVTRAALPSPKAPVDSSLVFEALYSFGNYNLFASGSGCKLWTSGVEYDRHSWGDILHAQTDYVAEVLPFVLLQEPTKSDYHGYPTTTQRRLVPGIGISPIGFRLLWRPGRVWQPYMEEKGGMVGFTHKVLNANATYENFTLQSSTGLLIKTHSRFALRVGLYSDFHMSNGFMVPTNPGLDVMNANFGLSYALNKAPAAQ
jgi:hypothetical protein